MSLYACKMIFNSVSQSLSFGFSLGVIVAILLAPPVEHSEHLQIEVLLVSLLTSGLSKLRLTSNFELLRVLEWCRLKDGILAICLRASEEV